MSTGSVLLLRGKLSSRPKTLELLSSDSDENKAVKG